MSAMKKNVVVIGSGIGISAIAALLANRGYQVTVLEKLGFIGESFIDFSGRGNIKC